MGKHLGTDEQNVTAVSQKIIDSNHSGGIHAVYNIYNCTKICELFEYAREQQFDNHMANSLWRST